MSVFSKKRKGGTTTWYYDFMYKGIKYRGRGGTTKIQVTRTQEKIRHEVINGEYELSVRKPLATTIKRAGIERATFS